MRYFERSRGRKDREESRNSSGKKKLNQSFKRRNKKNQNNSKNNDYHTDDRSSSSSRSRYNGPSPRRPASPQITDELPPLADQPSPPHSPHHRLSPTPREQWAPVVDPYNLLARGCATATTTTGTGTPSKDRLDEGHGKGISVDHQADREDAAVNADQANDDEVEDDDDDDMDENLLELRKLALKSMLNMDMFTDNESSETPTPPTEPRTPPIEPRTPPTPPSPPPATPTGHTAPTAAASDDNDPPSPSEPPPLEPSGTRGSRSSSGSGGEQPRDNPQSSPKYSPVSDPVDLIEGIHREIGIYSEFQDEQRTRRRPDPSVEGGNLFWYSSVLLVPELFVHHLDDDSRTVYGCGVSYTASHNDACKNAIVYLKEKIHMGLLDIDVISSSIIMSIKNFKAIDALTDYQIKQGLASSEDKVLQSEILNLIKDYDLSMMSKSDKMKFIAIQLEPNYNTKVNMMLEFEKNVKPKSPIRPSVLQISTMDNNSASLDNPLSPPDNLSKSASAVYRSPSSYPSYDQIAGSSRQSYCVQYNTTCHRYLDTNSSRHLSFSSSSSSAFQFHNDSSNVDPYLLRHPRNILQPPRSVAPLEPRRFNSRPRWQEGYGVQPAIADIPPSSHRSSNLSQYDGRNEPRDYQQHRDLRLHRGRAYDQDREHGYDQYREHGYNSDREHGYNPDRNRGYEQNRNRGYFQDRDHGYNPDRVDGYNPTRDHGYNPDRDHGYNPDFNIGYNQDRNRVQEQDRDRGIERDRICPPDRRYPRDCNLEPLANCLTNSACKNKGKVLLEDPMSNNGFEQARKKKSSKNIPQPVYKNRAERNRAKRSRKRLRQLEERKLSSGFVDQPNMEFPNYARASSSPNDYVSSEKLGDLSTDAEMPSVPLATRDRRTSETSNPSREYTKQATNHQSFEREHVSADKIASSMKGSDANSQEETPSDIEPSPVVVESSECRLDSSPRLVDNNRDPVSESKNILVQPLDDPACRQSRASYEPCGPRLNDLHPSSRVSTICDSRPTSRSATTPNHEEQKLAQNKRKPRWTKERRRQRERTRSSNSGKDFEGSTASSTTLSTSRMMSRRCQDINSSEDDVDFESCSKQRKLIEQTLTKHRENFMRESRENSIEKDNDVSPCDKINNATNQDLSESIVSLDSVYEVREPGEISEYSEELETNSNCTSRSSEPLPQQAVSPSNKSTGSTDSKINDHRGPESKQLSNLRNLSQNPSACISDGVDSDVPSPFSILSELDEIRQCSEQEKRQRCIYSMKKKQMKMKNEKLKNNELIIGKTKTGNSKKIKCGSKLYENYQKVVKNLVSVDNNHQYEETISGCHLGRFVITIDDRYDDPEFNQMLRLKEKFRQCSPFITNNTQHLAYHPGKYVPSSSSSAVMLRGSAVNTNAQRQPYDDNVPLCEYKLTLKFLDSVGASGIQSSKPGDRPSSKPSFHSAPSKLGKPNPSKPGKTKPSQLVRCVDEGGGGDLRPQSASKSCHPVSEDANEVLSEDLREDASRLLVEDASQVLVEDANNCQPDLSDLFAINLKRELANSKLREQTRRLNNVVQRQFTEIDENIKDDKLSCKNEVAKVFDYKKSKMKMIISMSKKKAEHKKLLDQLVKLECDISDNAEQIKIDEIDTEKLKLKAAESIFRIEDGKCKQELLLIIKNMKQCKHIEGDSEGDKEDGSSDKQNIEVKSSQKETPLAVSSKALDKNKQSQRILTKILYQDKPIADEEVLEFMEQLVLIDNRHFCSNKQQCIEDGCKKIHFFVNSIDDSDKELGQLHIVHSNDDLSIYNTIAYHSANDDEQKSILLAKFDAAVLDGTILLDKPYSKANVKSTPSSTNMYYLK